MDNYLDKTDCWEQEGAWVLESSTAACVFELKDRVEMLEAANEARTIEIIRLTNAVAKQVPNRNRLLTDVIPDEPVDDKTLVKRVQTAIGHSYPDDARVAIRKIANALQQSGHHSASAWLMKQLENELDHV